MTDIGREYGTALFSLALEENSAKEYYNELLTVKAVLDENPMYIDFLASPSIPVSERCGALSEAFENVLSENMLSFIQLLTEKGHARSFYECVSEYKKLLDEYERVSVAKVSSAFPLLDIEKNNIKSKLEKVNGHKVTLECTVDEKLLGGIVVEVDGKVMDGSIRHRLGEVKDVISK